MSRERPPKVLSARQVVQARVFTVHEVDLRFSNDEERTFEYAIPRGTLGVMIVPLINDDTLLLVREYAAGMGRYELYFPKGLMHVHEDPCDAANRELMEEVGYGARKLTLLKKLTFIPAYMRSELCCVLAQDLYPESLEGDEPEPLEVVSWPLSELDALLANDEFTEGCSIAALLLLKNYRSLNEAHSA